METKVCSKCEETKGYKTPCYINCKECGKIINFTQRATYRTSLKRSKNPGLCSSCVKKGDRNPFFDKKHTKESMDKMIETSKNSEGRKKYYEKIKSEEYRKYLSEWMKENSPMRGKSQYKIWVEKYGVEIANQKKKEWASKVGRKGEKSYWFGKTPPYGSGNGWSGWYKGWYFRSLIELTYMVNVIENYSLNWKTGESKEYKITFEYKGNLKNYFPDFIINDKYMIECKPKNLWKTDLIIHKKIAAEDFCKKNNLIYKIRDIKILSDDEILNLYNSGNLVWIKRYEQKFLNRIKKSNKIVEQFNNKKSD
jgi:hypothetical protein